MVLFSRYNTTSGRNPLFDSFCERRESHTRNLYLTAQRPCFSAIRWHIFRIFHIYDYFFCSCYWLFSAFFAMTDMKFFSPRGRQLTNSNHHRQWYFDTRNPWTQSNFWPHPQEAGYRIQLIEK